MDSFSQNYRQFYSPAVLTDMTIAFTRGGIAANSFLDRDIQKWYQSDIRSKDTDEFAKAAKLFGEGKFVVPITLATGVVFSQFDNSLNKVGELGYNSFKAYLIGLPFLYLTQYATGGSRPTEEEYGWKITNDDNGVSGHAYVGAVPFMSVARLFSENSYLKYSFYGMSVLTAWSRINDNKHYLSQACLGWFLALKSTEVVSKDYQKESDFSLVPWLADDNFGLHLKLNF